MDLQRRVERQAEALAAWLVLPEGSRALLCALAAMDLSPEISAERQRADEHNRRGIISWRQVLGDLAAQGLDAEASGRAVEALWSWGLVQVVGQGRSDPLVPGTAAIRLTYAARAALALSPPGIAPAPCPEGEPVLWEIWHGASQEGLLWEARLRLGPCATRPLRVTDLKGGGAELAGRVAVMTLRDGAAVLDVCGQSGRELASLLEEVLSGTRQARGPRLLLTTSAATARWAALVSGARMRWIELPLHGSQNVGFFDARVTEVLAEGHAARRNVRADVCGMPESDRALARRCTIQWEDVLFAPSVKLQLDQALAHARFRTEILPGRPTFPGQGAGYRLLLSGVPGTGKSMASEALASALDRPLITLDLSSVLSRWLGETEKFLSQVFEMAELGGCVLLLDEAEALFRQREGSDGGGGNALQTIVAFLLTRLERYSGVLVATTNRVKDLDEAFFRRFDDFVVVPLPDPATRRLLWQRMLALETDVEGPGVSLDILAQRFSISGGLIRGAALRARAWAEALRQPLSMPVVLAALARELEKNDRSPSEVFLEPYRVEVLALLRGREASAWD